MDQSNRDITERNSYSKCRGMGEQSTVYHKEMQVKQKKQAK